MKLYPRTKSSMYFDQIFKTFTIRIGYDSVPNDYSIRYNESLANQNSWKLGVFVILTRGWRETTPLLYHCFDEY